MRTRVARRVLVGSCIIPPGKGASSDTGDRGSITKTKGEDAGGGRGEVGAMVGDDEAGGDCIVVSFTGEDKTMSSGSKL